MCRCTEDGVGICSDHAARLSVGMVGIVALVWFFAAGQAGAQTRYPFEPFDEAASVPALFAVRATVAAALTANDVERLAPHVAADLNGESGGGKGWLTELRRSPDIFREAAAGLAWGGAFMNPERTRFCGPYWYAHPVQGSSYPTSLESPSGNPFIVTLPNLPVYERPDPSAKVVGHLGFELVRPAPDDGARVSDSAQERPNTDRPQMTAIQFEGKTAFVEARGLRDPDVDGSIACFELRQDSWLLTDIGRR